MARQFTLVELLVITVIIAILMSMLLPSLASARDRAKDAQCLNHLRQMGIGAQLYTDDYDSYCTPFDSPWPDRGTSQIFGGRWAVWMDILNVYLNDTSLFHCPLGSYRAGTPTTTSYAINSWCNYSRPPYEPNPLPQGTLRRLNLFANPERKVYYGDSGTAVGNPPNLDPGPHYSPFFHFATAFTWWDGTSLAARHRGNGITYLQTVGPTGGGANIAWMDGHASFQWWRDVQTIAWNDAKRIYWDWRY